MRQRIIRFIALYFVTVVVFALQHPLFMLFHNEVFGGIGFSDVVDATWHGLRLDLSMAGYLTTIPGLMLVASSFTPDIRWLTKSLRCWYVVVSVAMSLVFTVDVCLYGYWGFRLDATPVFYFFTSPADAMASVSGLFIFLGLIGAIIYGGAIYLLFNRVISGKLPPIVDSKRRIISAATLTVCSGILFIPIRGGFTTATMNLSVAYYSQNQRLNHAAINPMFSFMYSALHQDNFGEQYRYMDDLEATRLMETLTDNAPINTDSIPRLFTTNRPDVFIIILESFSSHLMPSLGGEPIAVNLDRMANEGISFTNFYACSFRTDRGLTSILSGYPALPGTSIMKYAEKVEHLPSISKSMKNKGYDLAYYYGGDTNFTNMQAYLVSAGFTKIISDKDFPIKERTSKWGAHDHVVFDKLLADLKEEHPSAPRLRVLQTSSSHEPFEVPQTIIADNKRKNAFAYTDRCLGNFIASLKTMPIWRNSVVIFVPDHYGCYPENLDDPLSRHHIPLVMIGGAVRRRQAIDAVCSQIDIAAILLDQLGIDRSDFIFSKDVLRPQSPRFAWFSEPSLMGFITDTNSLVYSLEADKPIIDEGEEKGANITAAKAFIQKVYDDIDKR